MERKMSKKYIELKNECSNKAFCIEAALSEYIDNSIQSILDDYSDKYNLEEDVMVILETNEERNTYNIIEELKKYNLTIEIKADFENLDNGPNSKLQTLWIKDNACGIKHDRLIECMEMNKTLTREKRRNKDSMNVYGVGMKNASFFLGNNTIIYSKTRDENFVSIGDYNAPFDQKDARMKDDVLMTVQKSYNENYLYELKQSGTIIKVQNVDSKYFNKFVNSQNNSLNNIIKTLGMKYFNYIKYGILKINFKTPNGEKGVIANSMIEYDENNEKDAINPFVIEKFYRKNEKKIQEKTPEDFQSKLKEKLIEICNNPDPKYNFVRDLYNNNLEFKEIFDDINKPIVFKMNCKIRNQKINESFPITICILNKPEQKFSNANVLAQWRYINLACFESSSNEVIKQFQINTNWTNEQVSGKWSFIEFNLKDLPMNKNFEYFKVDQNKTSFIDVSNSECLYERNDIIKSLKQIKQDLIPFTDIFKNIQNNVEDSTIDKSYKKNDLISKKIEEIPNSENEFYILNNNNEKQRIIIDDSISEKDKIITQDYKGRTVIKAKNNLFELETETNPKWILILLKLKENFEKLKQIKNWIDKNENIKNLYNYNEIKHILDSIDGIENLEELIKNG